MVVCRLSEDRESGIPSPNVKRTKNISMNTGAAQAFRPLPASVTNWGNLRET